LALANAAIVSWLEHTFSPEQTYRAQASHLDPHLLLIVPRFHGQQVKPLRSKCKLLAIGAPNTAQ
jgi:hypothetical protein